MDSLTPAVNRTQGRSQGLLKGGWFFGPYDFDRMYEYEYDRMPGYEYDRK